LRDQALKKCPLDTFSEGAGWRVVKRLKQSHEWNFVDEINVATAPRYDVIALEARLKQSHEWNFFDEITTSIPLLVMTSLPNVIAERHCE